MHAPTRELLRQDVAALDVPTVPRGPLPSASEADAYAPIAFPPPVQGLTHPLIDPDAIAPGYNAYPAGF